MAPPNATPSLYTENASYHFGRHRVTNIYFPKELLYSQTTYGEKMPQRKKKMPQSQKPGFESTGYHCSQLSHSWFLLLNENNYPVVFVELSGRIKWNKVFKNGSYTLEWQAGGNWNKIRLAFFRITAVCQTPWQALRLLTWKFSSVQLLSRVRLFATPWNAARQASLSITNSQSLLKLMSIESVMPSNHLILCHPLLLPP